MKEIIYLDTDLMNSMLAQLDEGLINSFSMEQWDQTIDTAGEQSARGKVAGLNASVQTGTGAIPGFNLNFGTNLGNSGNETQYESKAILDSQKDILNKAFHDYALEILINKLKQSNRIKESNDNTEGDLLIVEAPYKFYDFDLLKNLVDTEQLEKIFLMEFDERELAEAKRILKKNNLTTSDRENKPWAQELVNKENEALNTIKQFKQMELLSSYFAKALRGLSLIKSVSNLGILKKSSLRVSPEALSLRTDKSRNAKILMRVIGKKETVFTGQLNVGEFDLTEFDTFPTLIFDALLGSFQILEKGDILVTPIAIYYE